MIGLAGHGKDSRIIQLPFIDDISESEKRNENYTPDYFLAPCKKFLGRIDLDPFSNAIAQNSVQASTFWTKDDNALAQDWTPFQKKWVNPPYGAGLVDKCINRVLEFSHIGETLLLVNSSTSAKWFHRCMSACTAYLHPSKRILFYNPYREIEYLNKTKKRTGNEYDQTLFYFGNRPLEFAKKLEVLGNAVQPIRKDDLAISISGEVLIVEPINAKQIEFESAVRSPIQIAPNRELYDLLSPICNWYCGRELATFAVNALGHALAYAREGKVNEAVQLLKPEVLQEIKKPPLDVRKLKAFLSNFVPSIDVDKSPDLEIAIPTEPKLSVAKLRIDESKVSVLVETENKAVSPRTKRSKTCVDGISGKDAAINLFRKKLAGLKQQAIALASSGASPKGVWLEKSRPSKRNFDQVCWKADKPHEWLGGKKSRYIGKVDGDEHLSALTQFAAGKRLQEIEKEIKEIEKKLTKIKD